VDLELDVDGTSRAFTVSPLLANVILHFEDREAWGLNELAKTLAVKPEQLRKRLAYWVNQGVVKQSTPNEGEVLYTVVDSLDAEVDRDAMAEEEAGVDDGPSSADLAKLAEMKVYESYVTGMLTNFGTLPIDRIHNMLKVGAPRVLSCTLHSPVRMLTRAYSVLLLSPHLPLAADVRVFLRTQIRQVAAGAGNVPSLARQR
jgi:anaphase-promoting complex subunit 2